jgi:hypothetical protein
MGFLTKDEILSANDLETEAVSVPEWGGEVRVRAMTGLERDGLSQALRQPDGSMDLKEFRTRVCATSMVDEHGEHLFIEKEVRQLGAKSTTALDRVYLVASRLSGLGKDQDEALEKNSGKTQSDSSGSN